MQDEPDPTVVPHDEKTAAAISLLIRETISGSTTGDKPRTPPSLPLWLNLRRLGTQLWLESGDLEAIRGSWTDDFSGLAIDRTVLNAEVRKGACDDTILRANELLSHLPLPARIKEIAFILNVRHGLRLIHEFNPRFMSVGLHPDCADSVESTLAQARQYHAISPDRFMVKIPLTPAGLIAARMLQKERIAVELAPGFSVRQCLIATAFSRPDFIRLFAGRIGKYFEVNSLGVEMAGEKTAAAGQKIVTETNWMVSGSTRLIVAGIRSAGQMASLAGIDGQSLSPSVAQEAAAVCSGEWKSFREQELEAVFPGDDERPHYKTLWENGSAVRFFIEKLINTPPSEPEALFRLAGTMGIADLFPRFSARERLVLQNEGILPSHFRWKDRIEAGTLSIDSLLTAAGQAALGADQLRLEQRIGALIAGNFNLD